MNDVTYVLDRSQHLSEVGGSWTDFAVENGAPELIPPAPLGKPIASVMADETTIQIYNDIFDKVRSTGRPLSFWIRCDAPAIRRELLMQVAAAGDDLLIQATLRKAEARDPVPFPVDTTAPGAEFIRSCGWCKRVDVDGAWAEIEVAVNRMKLFLEPRPPQISHGICDSCLARMEAALDSL